MASLAFEQEENMPSRCRRAASLDNELLCMPLDNGDAMPDVVAVIVAA